MTPCDLGGSSTGSRRTFAVSKIEVARQALYLGTLDASFFMSIFQPQSYCTESEATSTTFIQFSVKNDWLNIARRTLCERLHGCERLHHIRIETIQIMLYPRITECRMYLTRVDCKNTNIMRPGRARRTSDASVIVVFQN